MDERLVNTLEQDLEETIKRRDAQLTQWQKEAELVGHIQSTRGELQEHLVFILMSYSIGWISDFIFHEIHELLHGSEQNSISGISGSIDSFLQNPYRLNSFDPLRDLIIFPYNSFLELIKTGNLKLLLIMFWPPSILIAMIFIYFKSLYLLFEKEDRINYYALIPILNNLTLLSITNKPFWWILPINIPFIRLLPKYFINQNLAKKYNKNNSFAIGMTLLPWFFYGKMILD